MAYTFHCDLCNENKSYSGPIGTGYAYTKDEKRICYACCAKADLVFM